MHNCCRVSVFCEEPEADGNLRAVEELAREGDRVFFAAFASRLRSRTFGMASLLAGALPRRAVASRPVAAVGSVLVPWALAGQGIRRFSTGCRMAQGNSRTGRAVAADGGGCGVAVPGRVAA